MTAEEIKRRKHKWIMKDVPWHQICERCGATRWGHPSGWGRAMDGLGGLPKRWCDK